MVSKKENVEGLNLPEPDRKVTFFFGKNGNNVEEKYALAKNVIHYHDQDRKSTQFFIRYGRGEIIDPYEVDFGVGKSKMAYMYEYKKVSEKAFASYVRYLQTKNRIHFTNARRLIME
jgi:hypothetical protein